MLNTVDVAKSAKSEFSPKESSLIDLLGDPSDGRSKEEKARAVGYKGKTVYWLQKNRAGFNDAVYRRMREALQANLPAVYASLLIRAKRGDVRAVELLLRAAGEIQSGATTVTTNVVQSNVFSETFKRKSEPERAAMRKDLALIAERLT